MLSTVVPTFYIRSSELIYLWMKVCTLLPDSSYFSHLPPTPTLATTFLLSVSMNLIFFFFTHHIYQVVFVFLCLAYFI